MSRLSLPVRPRVSRSLLPVTLLLAALVLAGCGRDEPAAVKDLSLLRRALTNPDAYLTAVAELEKAPKGALRALGEQTVRPGTREGFLLLAITDRVSYPGRYAAWDQEVQRDTGEILTRTGKMPDVESLSPLVSRRHAWFWAEKLLFGDAAAGTTAARHLVAIDDEAAHEALRLRLADRTRDADEAFGIAARGLAKRGDVQGLTAGLAAGFERAERGVPARAAADRILVPLRGALALLPERTHARAEQDTLRQLEDVKQMIDASLAERRALLVVLAATARPASMERLTKLRRMRWVAPLRADVDAAMLAAMGRDPALATLGTDPAGRGEGGP